MFILRVDHTTKSNALSCLHVVKRSSSVYWPFCSPKKRTLRCVASCLTSVRSWHRSQLLSFVAVVLALPHRNKCWLVSQDRVQLITLESAGVEDLQVCVRWRTGIPGGTGMDVVPTLPKCPVPVLLLMWYRTFEVSATGIDVVPNSTKCPVPARKSLPVSTVPVLMSYRTY